MSKWRVGIDIGGTFTDVVGMDIESGDIRVTKVPSIPSDPSLAVANGLTQLFADHPDIRAADVDFFAHGTTVATNAIIEGKGVKTGLLITEGFSAIYDLRGGNRPTGTDSIDPQYDKPRGLVPQNRQIEIAERIAFDGTELTPLAEDAVRRAARQLRGEGVTSIAVCYLFSFMDPAHEQRTREIILEEFPECRVSLSSIVLPLIREYFRLSTTVLDAYVGPVVANYLHRVSRRIKELGVATKRLFIMQSNGGLMQIDIAAEYPNQTLLSGPAAGVVFGASLGRLLGEKNVVTFDVGGTSTDISVLPGNGFQETRRGKIHNQDIGTPMIHIRTMGAGGGTIAWIGPGGALKGGPQSAGADPGPACYGLGGTEPTVTDANIVLGYLNPQNFIGGRFKIDPELSAKAITDKIARPLGLSLQQAALGIIRVVCVNIEVDLRIAFVERGMDPRTFSLVSFGGGGPVLSSRIASDMKIPRVIVPPYPGISCAMGLLQTDVKHVYMQSRLSSLEKISLNDINDVFVRLEVRARRDAEQEGFDPRKIKLQRQLDLRYPFQGYELTIDVRNRPLRAADKSAIRANFDRRHTEVYGTSAKGEIPDVVNIRVQSTADVDKLDLPALPRGRGRPKPVASRKVLFEEDAGYVTTPIYDRRDFKASMAVTGPAIIEQLDTTTVVLPGQTARMERYGNLIITGHA